MRKHLCLGRLSDLFDHRRCDGFLVPAVPQGFGQVVVQIARHHHRLRQFRRFGQFEQVLVGHGHVLGEGIDGIDLLRHGFRGHNGLCGLDRNLGGRDPGGLGLFPARKRGDQAGQIIVAGLCRILFRNGLFLRQRGEGGICVLPGRDKNLVLIDQKPAQTFQHFGIVADVLFLDVAGLSLFHRNSRFDRFRHLFRRIGVFRQIVAMVIGIGEGLGQARHFANGARVLVLEMLGHRDGLGGGDHRLGPGDRDGLPQARQLGGHALGHGIGDGGPRRLFLGRLFGHGLVHRGQVGGGGCLFHDLGGLGLGFGRNLFHDVFRCGLFHGHNLGHSLGHDFRNFLDSLRRSGFQCGGFRRSHLGLCRHGFGNRSFLHRRGRGRLDHRRRNSLLHDDRGRDGRRNGGSRRRRRLISRAQDHAVVLDPGLDPALDLALGDPVKHCGVRRGGLGPEVSVLGGQVAEVFRNRPHGVERVVEPLQRAAEGAVGHRQDLACTIHRMPASRTTRSCHPIVGLFESMDRPG